MWNEPWVCPRVGDAGTSGAGAVPLRSAQMMGQQQQQQKAAHADHVVGGTHLTVTANINMLSMS